MSNHDNSYDKYLVENDQFFYDENTSKKGSFLKQDTELFNEEDDVPGKSIQVKRIPDPEDWNVLVDGQEYLLLKGTRFTAKEREFLRTPPGILFLILGVKSGWKSVSEFKRQMAEQI